MVYGTSNIAFADPTPPIESLDLCQTLATASSSEIEQVFVETYRRILLDVGAQLITTADLERMLSSGDFFTIAEEGTSSRDHIADSLGQLRRLYEARIKSRTELQEKLKRLI